MRRIRLLMCVAAIAGCATSVAAFAMTLFHAVGIAGHPAQGQNGRLNIYYIATEGGQSTLFVGPTGQSLLVDTGNAGDRDLGRIVDTLKVAGVLTAQAPGQSGAGAATHAPAYLITVSAQRDGTFTVTNTRNGFTKTYKPRL